MSISSLNLDCFESLEDEKSPFSPITYERDLTFDEFITQTNSHNETNPYRKHIFIDCTDQS